MDDKDQLATANTRQDSPPAGSRRTRRPRFRAAAALAAAIVVVALGVGWLASASMSSNAAARTNAADATANAAKGSPLPGAGDPPVYWATIRQQLANGLHTTVQKLNRLWGNTTPTGPKGQSPPTPTTILDVAIEHGISQPRLRSIELAAIQTACNTLVHNHKLTARQTSARMKLIRSWSQPDLDGYSMYAFQQH